MTNTQSPIPNTRQTIFNLISLERQAQIVQWGQQSHPPERWLAILTEEIGEVATALLNESPDLYPELIQAAAVIVAWLEAAGPYYPADPPPDQIANNAQLIQELRRLRTGFDFWDIACPHCKNHIRVFDHQPVTLTREIDRFLERTNEL
jgi:hypothetical protein